MSDHCEILWVIRHSRYLDLGNGSNNSETSGLPEGNDNSGIAKSMPN